MCHKYFNFKYFLSRTTLDTPLDNTLDTTLDTTPSDFCVVGSKYIYMIKSFQKPIGRLIKKELLRKMLNIVMRKFNRILKTLQNLKTAP